jgi:hypothetical protein
MQSGRPQRAEASSRELLSLAEQPLAQLQDLVARVIGDQHGPHPDT